MLQEEEIKLISEETGFSAAQIERLYSRFKSLDVSETGSLSRSDFLRVPELAINPLCDRIVHMFFVDCDEDHDRINFRQFMRVLATFRSSAKPIRSRNASRQESIQNIFTSLSQNRYRHSRHSSCDGFFNYYPIQPHLTNQHSIHYVASTTHLASSHFSASGTSNYVNNNMGSHGNNNSINSEANHWAATSTGTTAPSVGYFKKPFPPNPLIEPDEPANSRKQKLFFMFKIYDVDNDNLISLNDLRRILKMMVGNYISELELSVIAEKTMRLADKNCNGCIDFDEFCTAFLHRDIDETLRVRFATQHSSISDRSGDNKRKTK